MTATAETGDADLVRWSPIVGDLNYEVSDTGCVRSLPRRITTSHGVIRRVPGGLLKPRVVKSGHLIVSISDKRIRYVHALVLTAFVGPAPEGMECRHKDDQPTNNHLSNLEWGTRSQNMYDRVRNGIHPAANKTVCKWSHRLVAPNLDPSELRRRGRTCLACRQAHSRRSYMRTKGVEIDLKSTADAYYAELMSA